MPVVGASCVVVGILSRTVGRGVGRSVVVVVVVNAVVEGRLRVYLR